MLLTHHIEDHSPTPRLNALIEMQRQNGGRLIQYRRAWAAIAIIATQDRVEWVAPGSNRCLAGWRHSLFTTVLGIWSIMSIFAVPIILFSNFRGGLDVTEFYSDSTIDPFHQLVPAKGTAEREAKNAQWAILGFLSAILALLFFLFL